MRKFLGRIAIVGLCVIGGPIMAQDNKEQTLADIRQDLTVLHVEIQKLKRELSTTSGATSASGGSVLDRVGAIENSLARLTAKTEELQFRLDAIVKDGTNRIADLEFRLVELEGGDVSKLKETTTLGGAAGANPAGGGAAIAPNTGAGTGSGGNAPQLAMGEQADFDAAKAALEKGDHASAATKFASFNETYPGSPMAVAANLGRGQALEAGGDLTGAARAYLEAFSLEPNGSNAPDALYHLGRGLGRLGQTQEACVTLSEVGTRFPGGAAETKAREEMTRLGCS